jgi:hypothetical protein
MAALQASKATVVGSLAVVIEILLRGGLSSATAFHELRHNASAGRDKARSKISRPRNVKK